MELSLIPLAQLDEPLNPHRTRIDIEDLADLAASIKQLGLIEPIIVEAASDSRYRVLAGHRRLLACRLAPLDPVPCVVRVIDAATAGAVQFAENSHRTDLTPWEEALAVQAAAQNYGKGYSQLARMFSRSAAWIASRLALFEYPPDLQDLVRTQQLSLAHAAALARVTDEDHRRYLATYAQLSGANSRVIDAWVQEWETAQQLPGAPAAQRPAMTYAIQTPVVLLDCDTCGEQVEAEATRILRVCLRCASTLAT